MRQNFFTLLFSFWSFVFLVSSVKCDGDLSNDVEITAITQDATEITMFSEVPTESVGIQPFLTVVQGNSSSMAEEASKSTQFTSNSLGFFWSTSNNSTPVNNEVAINCSSWSDWFLHPIQYAASCSNKPPVTPNGTNGTKPPTTNSTKPPSTNLTNGTIEDLCKMSYWEKLWKRKEFEECLITQCKALSSDLFYEKCKNITKEQQAANGSPGGIFSRLFGPRANDPNAENGFFLRFFKGRKRTGIPVFGWLDSIPFVKGASLFWKVVIILIFCAIIGFVCKNIEGMFCCCKRFCE